MKVIIKDDYLKDPDLFREIALSIDNYRIDNELRYPPIGWRGQRSRPLRELKNKKIDQCNKEIFALCNKVFNLKEFTYKCAPKEYEKPTSEFMITSYFHITTEETKKAYYDWQDRFHKDSDTSVAGVIYLNHNPPPKSGTIIFDDIDNQFYNVENVYNRFVCYEGYRVHALADVFGNSVETGRLTYIFFIHEKKFIDAYDS